ncbi:hypothetical protein [Streptomyces sp. NPDC002054]|uniref:hypothetical protein n=1 Tax=Streptomyces sp. NPDC002054 TaxID=3154663 RepID=UPI00332AD029
MLRRSARFAVPAAMAAACLVATLAPAAHAAATAPVGYSPACRTLVADGRAWLTKVGRDPHTSDPVVVQRMLKETLPLIGGETRRQVENLIRDIHEECYV